MNLIKFLKSKKGELDWEMAKVIIAVVVLVVLAGGVIWLFKGKGGEFFASFKDLFRGTA